MKISFYYQSFWFYARYPCGNSLLNKPTRHKMSSDTWVCRCSMGSSRCSLNTRTWGSTKQSNKICQEHQRTKWHHRRPDSSWTARAKGQISLTNSHWWPRSFQRMKNKQHSLQPIVRLWTAGTRCQWKHVLRPGESLHQFMLNNMSTACYQKPSEIWE